MALFNKKTPVNEEKTNEEKLIEYIEKCLDGGETIEIITERLKSKGWETDNIEVAIDSLNKIKKSKEQEELDADVDKKINKYPKFMRKDLKRLYKDYKKGNLIFPEGFDKNKFLGKK